MWNMLSCWKRNRLLLWHTWNILFCLLILCQSFEVSFQDSQSFLSSPTNPSTNLLQQPKTALRTINKAFLWPRSKVWMRARGASIQTAATKVTKMLYLSFWGRQLACGKFLFTTWKIRQSRNIPEARLRRVFLYTSHSLWIHSQDVSFYIERIWRTVREELRQMQ